MARNLSRREIALLGGAALVVVVWLYRASRPDAPTAEVAARKAAGKDLLIGGPVPAVRLDELAKPLVEYDPNGHDLFRYSPRPPTVAEVRRMKEEAARAKKAQEEAEKQAAIEAERRRKEEEARQAELALHPPPPAPPTPPAVTLQFVGFIGPPNDRIAALQQNNDTFLAKKGEIVQKAFKVEEIRYESVVLSFTDPAFKGQSRELPLSRGK